LSAASGLFEAYAAPADGFDELCTAPGRVRGHWSPLVDAFNGLGSDELRRRRDDARRQMRDNDVTFNIYGDPRGMGRPWELDLIPLVIGSDDWARIEAGLVQRAELLDRVLRDLYGPRTLIETGLLPPELVGAHPGFLRPCVAVRGRLRAGKPHGGVAGAARSVS
jgi:uncharacterized circularly permuted ATP-grasp superfamily protein